MIPFSPFYIALRDEGIAPSLKEWLKFLEALAKGAIPPRLPALYAIGRALLVKSETFYDRYDRAFLRAFSHLGSAQEAEALLSEYLSHLEGWEKEFLLQLLRSNPEALAFLENLAARLNASDPGSSPVPGEVATAQPGIRFLPQEGGYQRALKLAGERRFRAYDADRILDTAGLRTALARWRRTRIRGKVAVLDLPRTLEATTRNAGEIEFAFRFPPERQRILLLTDVGGSMHVHVQLVERFLTALYREIRSIVHLYFHNTIYEYLYRDAERTQKMEVEEVIRRYSQTHALVLVGDASMGPAELLYPHAAIEGDNEIASVEILGKLRAAFPRSAWLNPEPRIRWHSTPSLQIVAQFFPMHPLTIGGILAAMSSLLRQQ